MQALCWALENSSVGPHSNPERKVLLLSPFYTWESGCKYRWSDLSRVVQLASVWGHMWTRVTQAQCWCALSNHFPPLWKGSLPLLLPLLYLPQTSLTHLCHLHIHSHSLAPWLHTLVELNFNFQTLCSSWDIKQVVTDCFSLVSSQFGEYCNTSSELATKSARFHLEEISSRAHETFFMSLENAERGHEE